MSKARLLAAGVTGGIAMYVWMSVAHVALPLASTGISQIKIHEDALLSGMHGALGETSAMYLFPSMGSTGQRASIEEYQAKLSAGPSGLLIYHPPGQKALNPRQFVTEFLLELIEALLAVFLLAQTRLTSYGAKVGFIAVAGLLASLPTNISYWNWYGFPGSYTAAYMLTQIIGFVVVGLVAAAFMRERAAAAAAA